MVETLVFLIQIKPVRLGQCKNSINSQVKIENQFRVINFEFNYYFSKETVPMVNIYIFCCKSDTPHLWHQLQILSLAIGVDICTVQRPSEFENAHDSLYRELKPLLLYRQCNNYLNIKGFSRQRRILLKDTLAFHIIFIRT